MCLTRYDQMLTFEHKGAELLILNFQLNRKAERMEMGMEMEMAVE